SMKLGLYSRLHPEAESSIFEVFYELHRYADLDETIPVFSYWTVANRDNSNLVAEWEKKIGEYAMPPSLRCRDRCDSACAAFTDLDSRLTFLFASYYRTNGGLRCLLFVSKNPWFEVFAELLNSLAQLLLGDRRNETLANVILCQLENCPRVTPGSTLSGAACLTPDQVRLSRTVAPDDQLPALAACAPLRELYSRLSESDSLLFVLCALLCEKKLLLIGRRPGQLSLAVFGCLALLYPFSWEHVLAPLLSDSNVDHLSCLVPFVFGMSEALFEANKAQVENCLSADEDFILIRLDTGEMFVREGAESCVDALSLPSSLLRGLRRSLKPGNSSGLSESQFSQAFLDVTSELAAPLRQFALEGRHTCQPEDVAAASPDQLRPCLRRLCQSQLFDEFCRRYLAEPAAPFWAPFNSAADRVLAERRKTLSVPNARALQQQVRTLINNAGQSIQSMQRPGSGSRTLLSNHQLQQQQQVLSYKPIEDFNLPDDDEYDVVGSTATSAAPIAAAPSPKPASAPAPAPAPVPSQPAVGRLLDLDDDASDGGHAAENSSPVAMRHRAQLGEDPAAGAVADALHIRLSTVAPSNQSARPPPPRSQLAMPSLRPRVHEDLLEAFGVQPEELAAAPVSQEAISSEARVGRVNWESFSEA
ncbi:hypothetical protein BOX15_Mlig003851g2, partial [Macrostomum lignano]